MTDASTACRSTPTSRRSSTTRTSSRRPASIPNKPPTSLAEIREYADKITALGGDVKGYFLPGSCAGCNIFTVGPLIWASGVKIEADRRRATSRWSATGSRRCSSGLATWSKSGNVHEDARAENGETFAKRFGAGKIGMMGTGNFTSRSSATQNPDMKFGITPAAWPRAGLDGLVHRRRPRGRPEGLASASTTRSTS